MSGRGPASLKRWMVVANYQDEYDMTYPLNRWEFLAVSRADAIRRAMREWWDPRLDAASCSPDFYAE